MKSGIAAGQVAAWAIFGLFLSVDATLMTPPGTFYRMIGMALGQGPPADLYTGFALHMATATAIGVIYMVISNLIKPLYIGSVFKGLATGTMTGIAVWGVLFFPLHLGVMQPMLQEMAADLSSPDHELAARLVQLSTTILNGSLALHILFGGVLGFAGRLAHIIRRTAGKSALASSLLDASSVCLEWPAALFGETCAQAQTDTYGCLFALFSTIE